MSQVKWKELKKALFPLIIGVGIGCFVLMGVMLYLNRVTFAVTAKDYADGILRSFDIRSESLQSVEEYEKLSNEVLITNISSAYNGYDPAAAQEDMKLFDETQELQELAGDSDIRAIHLVSPAGRVYLSTQYDLIGESITAKGVVDWWQFDQLKKTAEEMEMARFAHEDGQREYHHQEPLEVDRFGETGLLYCAMSTNCTYDGDNYVIMECAGKAIDSFRTMQLDLTSCFTGNRDATGITSFLVNADSGLIVNGSAEFQPLVGTLAPSHGIDMQLLQNDGQKNLTIDGSRVLTYTVKYSSEALGNLILITKCDGLPSSYRYPFLALMFLMAAVSVVVTVIGITMEETRIGSVRRKMAGLTLLVFLLYVGAAYFFISCAGISLAMKQAGDSVEAFVENTRRNARAGSEASGYYQQRALSIAKSTRIYLQELEDIAIDSERDENKRKYVTYDSQGVAQPVPDVFGNPTYSLPSGGLMDVSTYLGAFDSVSILDPNGRTIATSGTDWFYEINSGAHSTDDQVRAVLERKSGDCCLVISNGPNQPESLLIAIPFELYMSNDKEKKATRYHSQNEYEKDETGTIRKNYGVLLIRSTVTDAMALGMSANIYTGLGSIESSGNLRMAVISAGEPHRSLYDTIGLTEAEIEDIGFTEDEYDHDTYKLQSGGVFGDIFFALLKLGDLEDLDQDQAARSVRVLEIMDINRVFSGRMLFIVIFSVVMLALLLVSDRIVIVEKQKEMVRRVAETPDERLERQKENRRITMNAGTVIGREQNVTSGMLRILLYIAALVLTILAAVCGSRGSTRTFLGYMIQKKWAKNPNIFSISYCLYLLIVITAVLSAARRIVELVASSLKPGMETVVRLVLSIVQYAGIMILIFYSMQMMGVQTGTVITFGGIITGVIGLGANSLISDIIAGLFIIFEREFRVNDIVTIDGFTGVVRGIGIRTTRVQDSGGNVKTFNNSKIYGVLNLTENYSTAFATMAIPLSESIDRVESLVNTELPKRMEDNPDIVEGPWFSGITEIKAGFYTISVGARCEQAKQWRVKNAMLKCMQELFKENEIRIS